MKNKEEKTKGALAPAIEKLKNSSCGCKAIFQLDRRGSEDCVFYDCDNPDFIKYVESFGFKEAHGSFSDISVIAPAWGVAAANLSVGYYNEHQKIEILKVRELEKTIERVKKILDDAENMSSYAYIPYKYAVDFAIPSGCIQENCVCCGKALKVNEGHLCGAMSKVEEDFLVCDDCYSQFF